MNIEQIALEVRSTVPVSPDPDKYLADLFSAFAAKIGEGLEPVAYRVDVATYVSPEGGYSGWETRITDYEPNCPLGSVRNKAGLYTTPAEAIIAAEQRVSSRVAELEAENARLKEFNEGQASTIRQCDELISLSRRCRDDLRQQLATAQEEIVLLKEHEDQCKRNIAKLQTALAESQAREQTRVQWMMGNCAHSDDCDIIGLDEDGLHCACSCGLTDALSIPSDDTTLRQIIEEKTRPLVEALRLAVSLGTSLTPNTFAYLQFKQAIAAAEGKEYL